MTDPTPLTTAAENLPLPVPLDYEPAPGQGQTRRQSAVIEPGLGQRTASGFAWVMAATVVQKLMSIGGQIVLAWLLSPDDFGVVAKAFTVVTFVNILREAGIMQVLVHRSRHFARWGNAAFWMSLTLSVACGLVLLVIAPIAARMFGAPQVKGLIWVLAIGSPIFGIATVPAAQLQSQLRFKAITVIGLVLMVISTVMSIAMAWMGFGPYSFVWPLIITGAMRVAIYWWLARPTIKPKLQTRRWKHLFNDSGVLFLATILFTVVTQGDYLILGLLKSNDAVGIYYFAFNLSMQTLVMLSYNLSQVLFPALSKLQNEPERQTKAFVRSGRQLALIGVPLCLMQVAMASPGIHAVFASKWYPAIPVVQILSIGAALRVLGMPSGTALQAQGRFKVYLYMAIFYSIGFVIVTLAGALTGGVANVAIAVAVFYAVTDNFSVWIAIRPGGGRWRDIWNIFVMPITASVLAIAIAWAAAAAVPAIRGQYWIQLAIIPVLTAAIYLPIIRWAAPSTWREFADQISDLRRRSASRAAA